MSGISIIIPTYNASSYLGQQLDVLVHQTVRNAEILIIDSSSTDDTLKIAASYGVRAAVIPKTDFDHGGTRTLAGRQSRGDILVYLTQDALPQNEYAIECLVNALDQDPHIGAAFGRQMPHVNATPFAKHLRFFNYPAQSYTRTFRDRSMYGVKTAFCSNSFAAYRRSALEDVGWFKDKLLMCEDIYACARMLMKGYRVGYVAEAVVYHSHNYSLAQEFKRYFDLGAFFAKESWILEEFGKPEGEGGKYVKSEISFLLSQRLFHYLPVTFVRGFAKLAGYKLGQYDDKFPRILLKRLSMHAK